MGKLKWVGTDFGNWRIEGRTVIHRSWSGVVWRKKGSASSYEAGCRFGKKPLPLPVVWQVKLFIDGGNIGSRDANIRIYVVRASEIAIDKHFEVRDSQYLLGYPDRVEVRSVTFDRLTLTKVWRWWYYDYDTGDLVFEDIAITVPPFNGLPPNVDQWVDEQIHSA